MRTLVTFCLTLGLALPVQATLTHSEVVKIVTTDGGTNLWIETDDNDSVITFHDPGNHWFSMGIDKSDSGKFKIRQGGDLNGTGGLNFQTDGRVFIDCSGTPHPKGMFSFGATVQKKMLALYDSGSTSWYGLGNQSSEFRLQTGSTSARFTFLAGDDNPVVTFRGDGKVGIGTVNPTVLLDVSGAFYTGTGRLAVRPQNGTTEGGQIDLLGSGSYVPWYLDNYSGRLRIFTGSTEHMTVTSGGNVGIGTSTPGNKLEVNGVIRSKEVIVESTGWPDDVFTADYSLPSLDEVERHIAVFGHLPGVPSESEVAGGVKVGDMQQVLLRKVEELTLHLIRQEKEIQQMRNALAHTESNR